jgi:uncharacterized protein YjiS (DUF1127 family)
MSTTDQVDSRLAIPLTPDMLEFLVRCIDEHNDEVDCRDKWASAKLIKLREIVNGWTPQLVSDEELEELRIKGFKTSALKCLDSIINSAERVDSLINNFREYLTKGRLSLADIGITEEHLEELRINGCKKSAVKYLDKLREGTDIPNFYTDNINKDLTEGGLSLADIGITEKELEELHNISKAKWLKRIEGLHRSS